MDRHAHDYATTNVLAWTATQSANVEPSAEEDAGADADEPPDCRSPKSPLTKHFKRAPVRRGSEHHESLLTKALQSHSDDERGDVASLQGARRRRSITSNFSLSSELTCDTGFTTPARTSSPSPQWTNVGFVPIATLGSRAVAPKTNDGIASPAAETVRKPGDPAVQALVKKRCISFACAARPKTDDKTLMPPPPRPSNDEVKPKEAPKETCIKFACPSQLPPKPAPRQGGQLVAIPMGRSSLPAASSFQNSRSPSRGRSHRPVTSRRSSQSPVSKLPNKWLSANSKDLQSECSRFHEFASGELQEDDWILHDDPSSRPKITINDTLQKENAIRKLGKEAEEEADQEEEEDEEEENDDGNEDEDDSFDGENGPDDDEGHDEEGKNDTNEAKSRFKWDEEASDGYKTDNEGGFADSEEEDDDLVLWTTLGEPHRSLSGATTVYRRPSTSEHSDSSDCYGRVVAAVRAKKRERRLAIRSGTPELPDSTDFVCGTLDEDRPLEEAYISHLTARKQGKLHLIPQDIDPSFPTSEPEDEAEELYKRGHGESDDDVWLHGELEDIHHDRERASRRQKQNKHSPKRCRSPPPKRRHSPPPPKSRGRSPRRLFDQQSPRRFRSPVPPAAAKSPAASPVQPDEGIAFKSLAFRPGLTHTKSLPRGPTLFPHLKPALRRSRASTVSKETHVRGAIDIVKGLEQKRQRRKEKFYQKYCNRARKEKAQVRRPVPGQGAVRMREVGLIIAGKLGQGNFVLSI